MPSLHALILAAGEQWFEWRIGTQSLSSFPHFPLLECCMTTTTQHIPHSYGSYRLSGQSKVILKSRSWCIKSISTTSVWLSVCLMSGFTNRTAIIQVEKMNFCSSEFSSCQTSLRILVYCITNHASHSSVPKETKGHQTKFACSKIPRQRKRGLRS